MYGEILVVGQPNQDRQFMIEELRRVSLWSDPLKSLRGPVALAGPMHPIRLEARPEVVIELFDMRMYYTLLSDLEPEYSDSDAAYPQLEVLRGRLSLEPASPVGEHSQALAVTLMLDQLIDNRKGEVLAFAFESIVLEFVPLQAQPFDPSSHKSPFFVENASAEPLQAQSFALAPHQSLTLPAKGPALGNAQEQRILSISFVNLSRTKTSAVLMDLVKQLIEGANKVWWEKGGLLIDPQYALYLSQMLQ